MHIVPTENSDENTAGPKRDAKGRVSGGNPGNSGGKKGRSGRKPDAFKQFCGRVQNDKKARRAIVTAARDSESRNFGTAWKLVTDYDDKKPGQKVEHSFNLTPEQRKDRIAELLTTAKARASNGNGNGHHATNGNGSHG